MSLVDFCSLTLSGTSRQLASSNIFRHVLPYSESPGSFTPTGTHSSCHRNSKTSDAKTEVRSPNLRPNIIRTMAKVSATTELCARQFSACYTPQTAHSLTENVSYNRRFRRSGHSSIPSPRRAPMTASFVSNAASC